MNVLFYGETPYLIRFLESRGIRPTLEVDFGYIQYVLSTYAHDGGLVLRCRYDVGQATRHTQCC